jgi:hypothetical protein
MASSLATSRPLANGLYEFDTLQESDDGRWRKDEPARGDELA